MKSKVRKIIEGLELFEAEGCTEVAADHEVIMAGCPDILTTEQKALLRDLGWAEDEHLGCFRIFVN
jgi:hypothetical protein